MDSGRVESGDATRRLTATSAAVKIEPKLASVVSLRVLAAQASQFTVDVLPQTCHFCN